MFEEADLKQVPLVHQLALALLQLGPQPPQLALIFAQQGALVHILIHPCRIADVLGSVGKLEGAQRLCSTLQGVQKRKEKPRSFVSLRLGASLGGSLKMIAWALAYKGRSKGMSDEQNGG